MPDVMVIVEVTKVAKFILVPRFCGTEVSGLVFIRVEISRHNSEAEKENEEEEEETHPDEAAGPGPVLRAADLEHLLEEVLGEVEEDVDPTQEQDGGGEAVHLVISLRLHEEHQH